VGPVLETLAEGGDRSVPFLVDCLDDGDASYWACLALAEIGPPAKAAVPGLTKLAAHAEPEMRLEAVVTLGEIGPDAKAAALNLLDALTKDEFAGVRYAAAYSLGKIGATTPAIDAALKTAAKTDDAYLRLLATWALSQLHPDDREALTQSVDQIVAGLKSDKPELRATAARCMVESNRTAEAAEVAAPHLAAGLKDADPVVVASALDAIATMGEKAVPRAATALTNPDIRLYAARVLQRIGPKAGAAVPALTEALAQDDAEFKREVQYALAMIGAPAAPAVEALIPAVDSDDDEVRHSAIYALGSIGEGAKSAVPALTKALSSKDEFTRFGAAWALVHVAPPDAAHTEKLLPVLIEGLSDDADEVRLGAAETLAQMGRLAKSAAPALQKAKSDANPDVAAAAARALEQIGAK
jgi:HEAT repeat protein